MRNVIGKPFVKFFALGSLLALVAGCSDTKVSLQNLDFSSLNFLDNSAQYSLSVDEAFSAADLIRDGSYSLDGDCKPYKITMRHKSGVFISSRGYNLKVYPAVRGFDAGGTQIYSSQNIYSASDCATNTNVTISNGSNHSNIFYVKAAGSTTFAGVATEISSIDVIITDVGSDPLASMIPANFTYENIRSRLDNHVLGFKRHNSPSSWVESDFSSLSGPQGDAITKSSSIYSHNIYSNQVSIYDPINISASIDSPSVAMMSGVCYKISMSLQKLAFSYDSSNGGMSSLINYTGNYYDTITSQNSRVQLKITSLTSGVNSDPFELFSAADCNSSSLITPGINNSFAVGSGGLNLTGGPRSSIDFFVKAGAGADADFMAEISTVRAYSSIYEINSTATKRLIHFRNSSN